MTAKPPQQSASIATFFIGGAGDKNRFWGIFPVTNLMRNELVLPYRNAISHSQIGTRERNVTLAESYYGYDEAAKLFAAIVALHKRVPDVQIRLVGHSLGGWCAAKLSEKLAENKIEVALLITIDPVGAYYFARIEGMEWTPPRPMAKTWINIAAGHPASYNRDDLVADLGMRWHPSRDSGLKMKPAHDYSAPVNHADVWKMMVFPGAQGKSAWDFLKENTP